MKFLNNPDPGTVNILEDVWIVSATDIPQQHNSDSMSYDRTAQSALPFEDYLLGKSLYDSEESQTAYNESDDWTERGILRQPHQTLQVFTNFEDVIEFINLYRTQVCKRAKISHSPSAKWHRPEDLSQKLFEQDQFMKQLFVGERIIYDGIPLELAFPAFRSMILVGEPGTRGVFVPGPLITVQERVEKWQANEWSQVLHHPSVSISGREDIGVSLTEVPYGVPFTLEGLWQIPANFRDISSGEIYTDKPSQHMWQTSKLNWHIRVMKRPILEFGLVL